MNAAIFSQKLRNIVTAFVLSLVVPCFTVQVEASEAPPGAVSARELEAMDVLGLLQLARQENQRLYTEWYSVPFDERGERKYNSSTLSQIRKEVGSRSIEDRAPYVRGDWKYGLDKATWTTLSANIPEEHELVSETISHEPIFDELRRGLKLDLADADVQALLSLYINSRLAPGSYYYPVNEESLTKVLSTIRKFGIPEKPVLPEWIIEDKKGGKTTRLRLMRTWESPYRGCLGNDCSTGTRLLRGLEPAHLYFAIEGDTKEGEEYAGMGQVEIVLGRAYGTGEKVAFIERFQSAKNLKPRVIAGILHGMEHQLGRLGYSLAILRSTENYKELGHPISNFTQLEHRIGEAISTYFQLSDELHFWPDDDLFPIHDGERFTFIAKEAGSRGEAVLRLRLRDSKKLEAEVKLSERTEVPTTRALSAKDEMNRLREKLEKARASRRVDLRELRIFAPER